MQTIIARRIIRTGATNTGDYQTQLGPKNQVNMDRILIIKIEDKGEIEEEEEEEEKEEEEMEIERFMTVFKQY